MRDFLIFIESGLNSCDRMEAGMKIVAGLGSVDDYVSLCEAGADEVFCGVVPFEWNERYGNVYPLNRREVLYYNVQISSMSEMRILKRLEKIYKVPVTITFNSLYYLVEQYEIVAGYMKELMDMGFSEFIIADISFMEYLRRQGIRCRIHLSGEACQLNNLAISYLERYNITRYIFHRKNTVDNMADMIKSGTVEYEAFVMNEKCNYTGAYCNSLHCDELVHMCMLPYELAPYSKSQDMLGCEVDKMHEDSTIRHEDVDDPEDGLTVHEDIAGHEYGMAGQETGTVEYVPGHSGCGLCSLYQLEQAGITHLKVVGRGEGVEEMVQDIRALKSALNICNEVTDINRQGYGGRIIQDIFDNRCSGNCYYSRNEVEA